MSGSIRGLMRCALAALAVATFVACSNGGGGSPEDVVKTYLAAWQAHDYAKAYPLLTKYMQQDLSKEAWATEQEAIFKIAEVQIFSFQTFPAKVEGEKAVVPNLLKSKDKFINQLGKNEYELYTLVKDQDGAWRIDKQELVESDGVAKWFPENVREDR